MAAHVHTDLSSEKLSDGFISLQDICKLHILFNLDLFPDYFICQLPRSIRNRLFRSLPIFDRLHYENAQFLSDLDIEDICPSPDDELNKRELYGSNDNVKERLVQCLFGSQNDIIMMEGCGLNLMEVSNFINFLSAANKDEKMVVENKLNYLKRYKCEVFELPDYLSFMDPFFSHYFVVPSRLMEFLSTYVVDYQPSDINMDMIDVRLFTSYCNLHTVPIRQTTLSIDTVQLLDSPIWIEYNRILESAIEKHQASSSTGVSIVNPISPLLQDILASVEQLSIGTNEEFEPTADDEDFSIDAPNFILTNIVSREKPRLKSIHIHGIARTVIDAVVTVGAFLCGVEDCPITSINNRYTPAWVEYSLVPPSKSCSIEKLVVTVESGDHDYIVHYTLANHSATVCDTLKRILKHQKETLKNLTLKGLGFTYVEIACPHKQAKVSSISLGDFEVVNCDEYRSLLNTTLVDFVQLPQFVSLELGDSPDTECYPLILAFMTTPTSHEQKLVISLRPDSKPTIPDWCEQYPIPTVLPHSNIQFKSLILNGTNRSKLVQHFFGFPDLSLCFLEFSTVLLEGKVPSTGVNIESLKVHVNSEVIDVSKLDVFISENPILKHLTISQSRYGLYNSSIFSVVNECLLRIVKKRMTLNSITLQEIQLSKHIHQVSLGMRNRRVAPQPQVHGSPGLRQSPNNPNYILPVDGLPVISAGVKSPESSLTEIPPSLPILPPHVPPLFTSVWRPLHTNTE